MYGATDTTADGIDPQLPPPQSDVIGPPGATAADGAVLKSGRFGTGLNIFISTVGTGVFVIPASVHRATLALTLLTITAVVVVAVAASRMVALAAGINKSPSYSEVIAIVLVGPDCRTTADDTEDGGGLDGDANASAEDIQMLSPLNPNDTFTSLSLKLARDLHHRQSRRQARARRVYIEYVLDAVVQTNNVLTCMLYARLIVDSLAPVLAALTASAAATKHHRQPHDAFRMPLFAAIFAIATMVGMLRSLQEMLAVVIIGTIAICIPLVAIVGAYYVSGGGAGYASHRDRQDLHIFSGMDSAGVLTMVASTVVANCYHNVVPQITREMKDFSVNAFTRVTAVASVAILATFGLVAFFGYMTVGAAVDRSDGMLLSVYPEDTSWFVMRLLFGVHLVCSYPIFLVNTRISVYRLYYRLRQQIAAKYRSSNTAIVVPPPSPPPPPPPSSVTATTTMTVADSHRREQQRLLAPIVVAVHDVGQQQQQQQRRAAEEDDEPMATLSEWGDAVAAAMDAEVDENALFVPPPVVEMGRTVGYESSAAERFLQSLLLASVAVGAGMVAQDTAKLSAWGGIGGGPLLLLVIPGAIAVRVYGGLWEGTSWAGQTGEADLYAPWPLGRAVGLLFAFGGFGLQLLMAVDAWQG